MRIGSLFSGIGGLELGLELALGGEVVWQVEQDAYARQVLARHWPDADRSVTDVREAGTHNLAPVDLICGGFPCQDISTAGAGRGLDGQRSGLFFELARVVREVGPRYIVLENVAAVVVRGLDRVLGEVASLGFDAEWGVLSARALGAPHLRRRWYLIGWLADAPSLRLGEGWPGRASAHGEDGAPTSLPHPQEHRLEGRRVAEGFLRQGMADAHRRGGRSTRALPDPHSHSHSLRPQPQRERGRIGAAVAASDGDAGAVADVAYPARVGHRDGLCTIARRASIAGAAMGGGQPVAHARCLRLEAHGQPGGLRVQEPDAGPDGRRQAQPGVGGAPHGLPARLDGWARGPGSVEPWEGDTPRTVPERGPHWKARLRCLGNAVVPQWSYEVGCRLADIIDPAGEAPTARPTPSVALASAAQATPPRHVGVEAGATLERE